MDLQVIILFTITILNSVFAYFIIRGEKNTLRSLFSLFVLSVGVWSLGLALFLQTNNLNLALKYSIFYYIAPAVVVLVFLYFTLFNNVEKI